MDKFLCDRSHSTDEVDTVTSIREADRLLNSNLRGSPVHMCIVVNNDDIHREVLLCVVLSYPRKIFQEAKVKMIVYRTALIWVWIMKYFKSELGVASSIDTLGIRWQQA